jgi:hypothetical protein
MSKFVTMEPEPVKPVVISDPKDRLRQLLNEHLEIARVPGGAIQYRGLDEITFRTIEYLIELGWVKDEIAAQFKSNWEDYFQC